MESDFIPNLTHFKDGWNISVKLPESHKKWISHIMNMERFRNTVKKNIESVLLDHGFHLQSYLRLKWIKCGLDMETDGNACSLYMYNNSYTVHNLDTYEQATIFFIALLQYLHQLYIILEMFENGDFKPEEIGELDHQLDDKIELNRFPECSKTYDECVNKYTYVCDTCLRNPKTALIPRDDYEKFSDKFIQTEKEKIDG